MWNNKWVVMIIVAAVVFGLIIVTNAHFNFRAGMGIKTFFIGLE